MELPPCPPACRKWLGKHEIKVCINKNARNRTTSISSFQYIISLDILLPDVCDDDKQLLYTKCSYVYPSGIQCTNPVPQYLDPLLCGGHCDNIRPPEPCLERPVAIVKQEITLSRSGGFGNTLVEDTGDSQEASADETVVPKESKPS